MACALCSYGLCSLTQTDRFGMNISDNCSFALLKDRFIENSISKFVILNEVKNLFLHKCTLFSFVGQMLRSARHDSRNQSV